ncbi:MAG: RNase adapter RapZ [Bacilli bacterium]|nr:RNase adapter RapZ [Bacilli bacterium]
MDEVRQELLLITGVSGAGKTTFATICEEMGYTVIEELPVSLLNSFLKEVNNHKRHYEKVALFMKINKIEEAAAIVRSSKVSARCRIVGLDCSKDVLTKRFRLTRHIHPLQTHGYSLDEAIDEDARTIESIHPLFDIFIDTSELGVKDLRKKTKALIRSEPSKLNIIISSFGYKYGLPRDAEVVFDARILANPYWVPELRSLTGLDFPVIDYIRQDEKTKVLIDNIFNYLDVYLKAAMEEGRSFVVIDIGCSGGQHRSVFLAEEVYRHFRELYDCTIYHREISRYINVDND